MCAYVTDRPSARVAGPELAVLGKWEEFTGWLLEHTARWPKSWRFGLVRRIDEHALDVLELLIVSRYEPRERRRCLHDVNLRLERLRFLLRLAATRRVMPSQGFETAMRHIDEVGRMVHGWRERLSNSESAP
jgi:hypothetical protein